MHILGEREVHQHEQHERRWEGKGSHEIPHCRHSRMVVLNKINRGKWGIESTSGFIACKI